MPHILPVPQSRYTVETYKDRQRTWRWRLRHKNGKIVANAGEGYERPSTMQRVLRRLFEGRFPIVGLVLLLTVGCAKPSTIETPEALKAYRGTQVIKVLDLLRDAAIDAHATVPPLVSEDITRQIVTYHQAAITVVHEAPEGVWRMLITGLDALEEALPPEAKSLFGPYLSVIAGLLEGLRP